MAWLAAAALLGAALLLALLGRRRTPHPPPPPPPPPAPVPVEFLRISGRIEPGRALETSVLTLRDGTDLVVREATLFSCTRSGGEVAIRLDAGEILVDSPIRARPLHVVTPHGGLVTLDAGFNVRVDAGETRITVTHGTLTVSGAAFKIDLARYDNLDIAAGGPRGQPVPIQTEAAIAWAVEAVDRASLLPNGGFEDGFAGWTAESYPETRVRLDRRAHSGRQAALVEFNAVRDYDHRSPRSDPVEVSPGVPHRFAGYVQFENLEVAPDGGPRLEVLDAREGGDPLASTPRMSGTSPWRKFVLDFTPPEGVRTVRISLTRLHDGSPVTGKFRLDNLSLFPLP